MFVRANAQNARVLKLAQPASEPGPQVIQRAGGGDAALLRLAIRGPTLDTGARGGAESDPDII